MKIFEQKKEYKFYAEIFKDFAKITYIYVKPKFRKTGVARKRVEDFIKLCIKKNVNCIKIDAYKNSLSFWNKIGFEVNCKPQIIGNDIQHYHDGIYNCPKMGQK